LKSLMLLWQTVACELATWCRTSTTRDFETVTRRSNTEGLSFLTITLPTVAVDLQKGLEQGVVDPSLFLSFKKKGRLPLFLGGFFDLVFDRGSGRLRDVPDVDAIFAIRQLSMMFGKILEPCSDTRTEKAITSYITCEKDVKTSDRELSIADREAFVHMAQMLFGDVFRRIDREIDNVELIPKHGPGSTADRLLGNAKYGQSEYTRRLDEYFPVGDYLLPNQRYHKYLSPIDILEPGQERPVRVITVPKTLKTPRIIAVEPTCMQYTQQALAERFHEYLEEDDISKGFLGFTDQGPNRLMACEGSITGSYASLDLSEASDRVSNQLVLGLFSKHSTLSGAVQACRSRKADVPGHGVIRLAKFASMGSALCFPVEAMVFTTIVLLGIQDELRRPVTRNDLKSLRYQVRVYGDDIIVPSRYVRSVIERLETFGLRVNSSKSYWNGKFRESCGGDYYDGTDVTPVRVRRMLPSSRKNASEVISTVATRNLFYKRGLWHCAKYLDDLLEDILFGYYPVVAESSPVLGRLSFLGFESQRLHPELHSPLVKGYTVRARIPVNEVDGVSALLKWFLKRGSEPFADRDHLRRSGRPEVVDIKLRWGSAH